MIDPFSQVIDAVHLTVDDLSKDSVTKPEVASTDGWKWHHARDNPLPEAQGYFAYDLEAVPDERFERPQVREIDPIPDLDIQAVLKTEGTTRAQLREGLCPEQIAELLDVEQAGKSRKGVLKALEDSLTIGSSAFRDWSRNAVNPANAMICAMSICDYHDTEPRVWLAKNRKDERDLVEAFFDLLAEGRVRVGYNIHSYDDRLIAWRALRLGVKPPAQIKLSNYGSKQSIDLMQVLFKNVADSMKLKTLLPLMGIEPPAGEVDGSMVLEMVDGAQWEQLARYVASDAWSELQLFRKIQSVVEI